MSGKIDSSGNLLWTLVYEKSWYLTTTCMPPQCTQRHYHKTCVVSYAWELASRYQNWAVSICVL